MRVRAVVRVLAVLLLIVSVFLVLPTGVAVIYHEYSLIWSFLVPMALVWIVCVPTLLVTRRASGMTITNKGGYLLVSSGWILAAAFSALPFYLSGAMPHYTDAFFETMSGYTTTGASILTNIQALPKAMLFWRSLTHWLGGMGIVVLTVAVFPLLGIGGLQLVKAEAPGPTVDKITPKITSTAKILWLIYVLMTVVEIVHAIHDDVIKGMYIMGENPAMSDPDAHHARGALAKLEHLVVQDLFLTETATYADVVLPASAWPEKDGTVTNSERRISRQRPFRPAPGAARPDWWMFSEVGRRVL